ncbi:MAG TPA: conjugal transfer protein TraN [Chlamydiales bacterium]|nr:conjugal transfer protein TraN [Chlamydiales bacterium]
MKNSFRYLFIFLISLLSAQAQDQEYLDTVAKIKEQKLPAPDYTMTFDDKEYTSEAIKSLVNEAEQKAHDKKWSQGDIAFINSIQSVPGKIEFFGDEAEFHPEILANPLAELDISSVEKIPAEKETALRMCEESGTFEREFVQRLEVILLSEPKKVKRCNGHHEIQKVSVKEAKNKKDRKKIVNQKINKLKDQYINNQYIKNEFSINAAPDTHEYHVDIIINYQHFDDTSVCDMFQMVEVEGIIEEKDEWKTDLFEEYDSIRNNPNCKLQLIRNEGGPEFREIDGHQITRNSWIRTLLYQCAPDVCSPCQPLRKQGGQLVKKRCIRENEETGQCELWELTYDVGKSTAAYTKCNEKNIWGMDWQKIDPDSLKSDHSSDFLKIFGILKSITQMPIGEWDNLLNCGQAKIFNGAAHRCRCNHNIKELQDCCKKMSGVMTLGLWSPCSEEELELKKMNDEGRCHKIGSYIDEGLFDIRHRVFCCFPTKLLRIFNEQARKQMGMGWGTVKKPDCRGFSLEELSGKADLSLIDFSEAADDLAIDEDLVKTEMLQQLQSSMENPTLKNLLLKEAD